MHVMWPCRAAELAEINHCSLAANNLNFSARRRRWPSKFDSHPTPNDDYIQSFSLFNIFWLFCEFEALLTPSIIIDCFISTTMAESQPAPTSNPAPDSAPSPESNVTFPQNPVASRRTIRKKFQGTFESLAYQKSTWLWLANTSG